MFSFSSPFFWPLVEQRGEGLWWDFQLKGASTVSRETVNIPSGGRRTGKADGEDDHHRDDNRKNSLHDRRVHQLVPEDLFTQRTSLTLRTSWTFRIAKVWTDRMVAAGRSRCWSLV